MHVPRCSSWSLTTCQPTCTNLHSSRDEYLWSRKVNIIVLFTNWYNIIHPSIPQNRSYWIPSGIVVFRGSRRRRRMRHFFVFRRRRWRWHKCRLGIGQCLYYFYLRYVKLNYHLHLLIRLGICHQQNQAMMAANSGPVRLLRPEGVQKIQSQVWAVSRVLWAASHRCGKPSRGLNEMI